MTKLYIKSLVSGEQMEEFGIFINENQTGNLFIQYHPGTGTVSVDGAAYLQDGESKDDFLMECSEELFPELLNRGIQDIEQKRITVYQKQKIFVEELPSPAFKYGHPNSW